MTALETAALYYDAWQNKHGDFSEVPLADDLEFTGPAASFNSAEGYRAIAREAGRAVTSFQVRRQFVEGNTVCSIIGIAIFSTIAASTGILAGPQAASGISHAFVAAAVLASVASLVALAILPGARQFVVKLRLNPVAMPVH